MAVVDLYVHRYRTTLSAMAKNRAAKHYAREARRNFTCKMEGDGSSKPDTQKICTNERKTRMREREREGEREGGRE